MSEHHASSHVAHQFDDATQQQESSTLGMWVFLVTEIMFFGGLILAYTVYRASDQFNMAFHHASQSLDIWLGGVNTCVLLVSSLTMALAVRAAQVGRKKQLIGFIIFTMILGTAFLVVKYFEYSHKFHEGWVPGPGFAYPEPKAEMFFNLYFALTGLHAFHMVIGLGLMFWLLKRSIKGDFSPAYYNPVEMGGLYWHFVDIVWIFLFPLLYLIDRSAPVAGALMSH